MKSKRRVHESVRRRHVARTTVRSHAANGSKGVVEESKGLVFGARSSFRGLQREEKPPETWESYWILYMTDPKVFAAVEQTVAEAVGMGFYLECEDEASKKAVDDYCRRLRLDQLSQINCRSLLVQGNFINERVLDRSKLITKLKVLPAHTMRYARAETGQIEGWWQQKSNGQKGETFTPEEILHGKFIEIESSAWGMGLIQPNYEVSAEIKTIRKSMIKIIKRYAGPKGLWPVAGDDSARKAFAKALQNIQEDEDFVIPPDIAAGAKFLELNPSGRFENYINSLKEDVTTGLRAPTLGYLRNATQASATKLTEHFQNSIASLQRELKRIIEQEIFKPFCDKMRLKEVPKLTWGMQRTGVEKLTAGDVARLVQVASITPAQSQVLLRKMGVPLEDVPNDPDSPEAQMKQQQAQQRQGIAAKLKGALTNLTFGKKKQPDQFIANSMEVVEDAIQ